MLSMWNPYEVYLMSSTFTLGTPARNASVVNAASYSATAVSPASIASLYAPGLAASTAATPSLTLPATLAGASVTVQDSAGTSKTAALFFVSPGQINFLMPAGLANGSATASVVSGSTAGASGALP